MLDSVLNDKKEKAVRVAQVIVDDLKTSWYFRVWLFLFVLCGVLELVCLIILGHQSDVAGSQQDIVTWAQNAGRIEFPRFRIRFRSNTNGTFVGRACTHEGRNLPVEACTGRRQNSPMDKCFAINTKGVLSTMSGGTDYRIDCAIQTKGNTESTENELIEWELEDSPTIKAWGTNSYAGIWVKPCENAWVRLVQSILTENGVNYEEWQRRLTYGTTVFTPGMYKLAVILDDLTVLHFEQANSYTGWMSVGDIGGFAFFLLIMQTITMAAVSVFVPNDSKFFSNGPVEPTPFQQSEATYFPKYQSAIPTDNL